MPNEKTKMVLLSDDCFKFIPQKTSWTKEKYRLMDTGNINDIPIYTAALHPVAFVSGQSALPIPASTDSPVISFGANGDGSAGTNFVFHARPFYVSNDRTCFKIIDANIDSRFVFYSLRDIKRVFGFDFQYKATKENVSSVPIAIPLTADGRFDVEAQRKTAEQIIKHETAKEAIVVHIQRISTALVTLAPPSTTRDEVLSDQKLFSISIGKRELIKDVSEHGTRIYSANVRKPFGFTSKPVKGDFASPSLIWGIDGIFDWNILPENQAFLPTDHCGVLKILHPQILPLYAYHMLRSTRERYGFDRTFRASLANIGMVSLSLPIKNGTYDLEAQVSIAERYQKIERIRASVVEALARVTGAIVDYSDN